MTASTEARAAAPSRMRDPRVWLGLAVALLAVWLALRGVDLRGVWQEFERARWGVLLGISVPAYLAVVWLRALRWRHLTDAIQPMPRPALFRAVAVGFMANNIFPLRIGEIVRVGYLARETRSPAAAVLATVVLERVIDGLSVLAMALGAVAFAGGESEVFRHGIVWLAPVALVPLAMLVWLRAAPENALGFAELFLRFAPARVSEFGRRQLRGFADGLGALRGGAHLAWIAVLSIAIWLVASTLPIIAAIWAVGVDVGGPIRTIAAGWTTLAALGAAVALPQAPGFFGLYHAACRMALQQFGASAEQALAVGTLCHAVFWATLTGLGALVLRSRHAHLSDLQDAAE
ncbi:MAG TPA: lysylphosphatidylglycerol synthase transmembrane domain-containing protein [Myxococcota bacterium]|nr:lysylphosphatidylglycerol synthase transmembrane domain-containing protein [Myxococcota bacterium]